MEAGLISVDGSVGLLLCLLSMGLYQSFARGEDILSSLALIIE